MEFNARHTDVVAQATGCLLAPVFEGRKLPALARELDAATGGALKQSLRAGDIAGRVGDTLLLSGVKGLAAERVMLVGFGREKKLDAVRFRKALDSAARALAKTGARNAVSMLADLPVADRGGYWRARQMVEATLAGVYHFDAFKSGRKAGAARLKKLTVAVAPDRPVKPARIAVEHGMAIGAGIGLARDLGNTPGNVCTPSYLAKRATDLAAGCDAMTVTVLEEADMRKAGMGALLSVSRGSRQPAKLIALQYSGAPAKHKPVVLVGKGVTFDSGGISIKPGAAMDEMKFDMCGAASVLGVMTALAQLRLPINVVGVVPTTENLPDGDASKPGDIVTSLAGKTIEILNTDAEGRLILCDALTWAKRFNPGAVIDIATLTGACIVALGNHVSGLMSNHDALADDLLAAGKDSVDPAWRLPLDDDYDKLLQSNFADMANIGGRSAGAITAACFLARFTRDYHWAHLDIAGTAWTSGRDKGATGRPVGLLMQYLLARCKALPAQ